MIEMVHSKIMTGTASEALKTENVFLGAVPPHPCYFFFLQLQPDHYECGGYGPGHIGNEILLHSCMCDLVKYALKEKQCPSYVAQPTDCPGT